MIFVNCCKFQGIDGYSPKLPCNHSNKPGEVTLALIGLAHACFFFQTFPDVVVGYESEADALHASPSFQVSRWCCWVSAIARMPA